MPTALRCVGARMPVLPRSSRRRSGLRERGFAATELDDIAAQAGVSKGTLYLYFPSKEELFKAVIRERSCPISTRAERARCGARRAELRRCSSS